MDQDFFTHLAIKLQIMPLIFVQGYTESPIHQFAPLLTTTIVSHHWNSGVEVFEDSS